MGGLSRKSYKIKEILSKDTESTVIIDGGNCLFKSANSDKIKSQDLITAEGIMSILQKIGYSAVNVGHYDLSAGSSFLTKSSLPWISSNFFNKSGDPLFSPYLVKNIGDIRVAIIGITSQPRQPERDIVFKKWQEVLPKVIKDVTNKSDFVILLSTLSEQENSQVAQIYPSIRLIISATLSKRNVTPKLYNNSILTQTDSRGKYLGYLSVSHANRSTWEKNYKQDMDYQEQRIKSLEKRIEKLKEIEIQNRKTVAKIQRLEAKKIIFQKSFEDLEKQNAANSDKNLLPSTFNARFIALTPDVPEDEEVKYQIEILKERIKKNNSADSK